MLDQRVVEHIRGRFEIVEGGETAGPSQGPETCAACRFRSAVECHRFPPVAAIGAAKLWPAVADDDWCGEHSPKA